MRRKLLAANWKMYKTPAEAQAFCRAFLPMMVGFNGEVALCPPAVCIPATADSLSLTSGGMPAPLSRILISILSPKFFVEATRVGS